MITIPVIGFFLIGIVLILNGLFAIKNKWISLGVVVSSIKRKYINRAKFLPWLANFMGADWFHKGREAVIIGYILMIIGILFIATSILIFIS